jgi:hypothetical protein
MGKMQYRILHEPDRALLVNTVQHRTLHQKILSQLALPSTALVHSLGLRKVRQSTIVEVPKRSKKDHN